MKIDQFRGEYRFLSNFYPSPIVSKKGTHIKTVEHGFQAAKALSPTEQAAVLAARTPGDAKRMGRKVQLRPDWDEVKDRVMLVLVRAKFQQNSTLRVLLLRTGDAELVEGNTWGDTYWGVCRGEGQNKLGKTLMQVREELKEAW